jgi:hypothetical protein
MLRHVNLNVIKHNILSISVSPMIFLDDLAHFFGPELPVHWFWSGQSSFLLTLTLIIKIFYCSSAGPTVVHPTDHVGVLKILSYWVFAVVFLRRMLNFNFVFKLKLDYEFVFVSEHLRIVSLKMLIRFLKNVLYWNRSAVNPSVCSLFFAVSAPREVNIWIEIKD